MFSDRSYAANITNVRRNGLKDSETRVRIRIIRCISNFFSFCLLQSTMPNGSNATFDLDIVYVLPRHDNALLVRVELNNKHSDFRLKYLFFFEKTIINCVSNSNKKPKAISI